MADQVQASKSTRVLRSKDPIVERLGKLGISLPEAPQPLGAYLPVVESGSTLYVSMQGPLKDGKSPWSGPESPRGDSQTLELG